METDEILYRRYIDGEDDALRTLLERHRDGLTLFLYGMVGSMEDAEDLMMDSFAALLAKDKPFLERSSFKTWLFAIGRNKALAFLRKTRRRPTDMETPQPEQPGFSLLRKEQNRQLYRAIAGLKEEYRQALYLTCLEEMTVAEAARVMKKTARQVTFLTYRGKQALKKVLEQEGVTYAEHG